MLTRSRKNQPNLTELNQTLVESSSRENNLQSNSGKINENLTEKLEELYNNIRAVPSYSAKIKEFLKSLSNRQWINYKASKQNQTRTMD